MLSALAVIAIGALLPVSPVAHTLGFVHPSLAMYGAIAVLVVVYVGLVDAVKTAVLARLEPTSGPDPQRRQLRRRLSRFPVSPT